MGILSDTAIPGPVSPLVRFASIGQSHCHAPFTEFTLNPYVLADIAAGLLLLGGTK